MRSAFMHGFLNELEKTALDLKSAKKMTDAVKPNLIRRGLGAGTLRVRAVDKSGRQSNSAVLPKSLGAPLGPMTVVPSRTQSKTQDALTMGKPRIFARGKHSLIAGGLGIDPKGLPSGQKEMHRRMIIGHEGSEIRHRRAKSPQFAKEFNHMSPKVLVEESNMVGSLPSGYEETKNRWKTMRAESGESPKMERMVRGVGGKPGFVYGQRYSRHAKKHIANIVERKMQAESDAKGKKSVQTAKPTKTPEEANKELRDRAIKAGVGAAKKVGGHLKGWLARRKARKVINA